MEVFRFQMEVMVVFHIYVDQVLHVFMDVVVVVVQPHQDKLSLV